MKLNFFPVIKALETVFHYASVMSSVRVVGPVREIFNVGFVELMMASLNFSQPFAVVFTELFLCHYKHVCL